MRHNPLIVLKFGGSVLLDRRSQRTAVHEIYRWRRSGWRVVAVVSALSGRTEALISAASELSPRADSAATAALVSCGELESAAALGLHLDRAGIPGRVLTPAALGLIAEGDPLDADPVDLAPAPLQAALDSDGVAVVPGFVAVDRCGRTVLLGRGGSDLTALFLAHRLGADACRLVKDVDGLFERDPAASGPLPGRYAEATWNDALATDGSIIQPKAVRFAAHHGLPFQLAGFNSAQPTTIGAPRTRLSGSTLSASRIRIALLGLGVVGGGVLDLLLQFPDRFEIVAAVSRDLDRMRESVPAGTLRSRDPAEALRAMPDIVVESLGGVEPARTVIEAALRRGAHVVTSNKAVLALHAGELSEVARGRSTRLLYSASVGGSLPLLETLAGRRRPRSVRAVLNGTTNFVLNARAGGATLQDAINAARRLGLTESDASRDLNGLDAADKLAIIAHTIGAPLATSQVSRNPIAETSGHAPHGGHWRQVASLKLKEDSCAASVRFEHCPPEDPLASVPGEHNAAIVEWDDGSTQILRGRGAGRWPTAEAVLGDILELARAQPGPRTRHVSEHRVNPPSGRRTHGSQGRSAASAAPVSSPPSHARPAPASLRS